MEGLTSAELSFEEPLLRNPYSLTHWLNYLEYKSLPTGDDATSLSQQQLNIMKQQRYMIYERALKVLPMSYKLWMKYLNEKISSLSNVSPLSSSYLELNNLFERALSYLHKMPLLWLLYLSHLQKQPLMTYIRHTFDRALQSIASTQHLIWIWPEYIKWITSSSQAKYIPNETKMIIYKRYLLLNNSSSTDNALSSASLEDYVKLLIKLNKYEEAAIVYSDILNTDDFISQYGKSKYDLWSEFLSLLMKHTLLFHTSSRINIDKLLRSGIQRFAHDVGRLYVHLANYYASVGLFEKTRDIYEEAIYCVNTVRDFSIVFDAYTKFEEQLISVKMKQVEEGSSDNNDNSNDNTSTSSSSSFQLNPALLPSTLTTSSSSSPSSSLPSHTLDYLKMITNGLTDSDDIDLDMSIARLDDLMQRRPFLLSSVLLRQNPHNVNEWYKRIQLYQHDPIQQIKQYTEAVHTIDPHLANNGKIERLWSHFAKFYEKHHDLDNARIIYEKATQVNYKHVDALVYIWCEWIEMELKHGEYQRALSTIKQACTLPKGLGLSNANIGYSYDKANNRVISIQEKLYKSTKIWSLYADLCENLCGLDETKKVYDQMFYLKIVTPHIVLSYANLLWEHNYYEEAFRIYEKGIAIFIYPHVYPIWLCYINRFIQRYQGSKLERTRELFEQALQQLPISSSSSNNTNNNNNNKKDSSSNSSNNNNSGSECKKLYLLYAKFEEDYGLARRSMDIYQRACDAVSPSDKYEMYLVYIARCAYRYGIIKTRSIYEHAIKSLPDIHVRHMCLKYTSLEKKLGEIDRCRAIFIYGSQYADPRVDHIYWKTWSDFEVTHGNQETFKEMLRIKRTVLGNFASTSILPTATATNLIPENSLLSSLRKPAAAAASTTAKAGAASSAASATSSNNNNNIETLKRKREEQEGMNEDRQMGAAERMAIAKQRQQQQQQQQEQEQEKEKEENKSATAPSANPDEIDLDEEEEEQEEEEEETNIAIQSVPNAVFGL